MNPTDLALLQRAIEVARQSRAHGNHPFGALLADAAGVIRLEAENSVVTGHDCTGHAETNLMRLASQAFEPAFLAGCTLYTSTEPCAMCAGAIYWGGVGRVVFAISEVQLLAMTGGNPENPTLALPCREVFAHGQRAIAVDGPAAELDAEGKSVHLGFWD
ncbi:MAG: nucleoside deaminase [Anaerolineales bacterium]